MGIIWSFVASLILSEIGRNIETGIAGSIVHATFGAVILLVLLRVIKRTCLFCVRFRL
ncbi:GlsB/YeaQ/YmgE family stress response membrane protein [Marivita lacus]|uniref:GlsB/YeaQ/YmgE family stress response membrane protein n=1 Tax=Marivita lacus TaxID=1323742 RepID=UPI00357119BF